MSARAPEMQWIEIQAFSTRQRYGADTTKGLSGINRSA
jgi:hypothetical protein